MEIQEQIFFCISEEKQFLNKTATEARAATLS